MRRVAGWMSSRALIRLIVLAALAFVIGIVLRDQMRRHPENMPWTPLSLAQPIGMFTGRKLVALTTNAPQCLALLTAADVRFKPLGPITSGECSYADGVTLRPGGATLITWRPANLGVACPVAAALAVWEREIVRPAALRHFGRPVAAIEHYGSFNCRRIYGRPQASWSEHATADAIDIAAFRFEGGTRVTVQRDWTGTPAEAAFLREIRDGACRLFATVLSPDYNAAHADHFHFDQAERGAVGGSVCR